MLGKLVGAIVAARMARLAETPVLVVVRRRRRVMARLAVAGGGAIRTAKVLVSAAVRRVRRATANEEAIGPVRGVKALGPCARHLSSNSR
jgi:hypothetical protein